MTAQGMEYLAKMANDIARNMAAAGDESVVARRVSDHLARFWSPDMRRQLVEHVQVDDSELLPAVRMAVGLLE